MAPQASKKYGLLTPDHHRIGSCTSNGLNSEQVSGTIFMLQLTNNLLAFWSYCGGLDEPT
jgi:hypothetical protein